jgi:hypothetical protein
LRKLLAMEERWRGFIGHSASDRDASRLAVCLSPLASVHPAAGDRFSSGEAPNLVPPPAW